MQLCSDAPSCASLNYGMGQDCHLSGANRASVTSGVQVAFFESLAGYQYYEKLGGMPDCSGTPPAPPPPDDTCHAALDGTCDTETMEATDTCGPGYNGAWANDGLCDVPAYCDAATDDTDCGTSALRCELGTDETDCGVTPQNQLAVPEGATSPSNRSIERKSVSLNLTLLPCFLAPLLSARLLVCLPACLQA